MTDLLMTSEEEVARVLLGQPHLVLLGAGASLAAFPDGDATAHKLPLMSNFVDVVGLHEILDSAGIEH